MNIKDDEYYDEADCFTGIPFRHVLEIFQGFSEEELDEKVLNAEHLYDLLNL